jgi:hypothetical protein
MIRAVATICCLLVAVAGPLPLWLHQLTAHHDTAGNRCLQTAALHQLAPSCEAESNAATIASAAAHSHDCCTTSSQAQHNHTDSRPAEPGDESENCSLCFALQQCMTTEVAVDASVVWMDQGRAEMLTAAIGFQEFVLDVFLRGPPTA